MSLVDQRRSTRQISVGNVKIGSMAQVSVQSMTNTQTQDVVATVNQILALEKAGCEIIRVAVPDMEAAQAIEKIKQQITIPIIADIHFDFRLALASATAGADALRINPGNIGEAKKIKAVVDCAKKHGIPIRIGVNAGSLEQEIEQRLGTTPQAMVESAVRNIKILEDLDFHDIKVSLKASDVSRTVSAYRLLAPRTDVPFHIGVTEAGGLYAGITKSAIGIGMLLAQGLGDTLRVSLTRDPVEEVRTGYEILRALGIRSRGPELISCPTCGRCKIDLFKIAEQVEKALLERSSRIKVAIMGCVVNGPGEAKEADIGIAGGDGKGILFKKGKVIRKIDQDELVDQLLSEIDKMIKNSEKFNGKKE
ncbi:flavodoxin-dependent (E)-4-hydroxy-3-methylbut-2-enyl-diphosphate synthase [Desulfobacula toluolica]|uniref:4-hydroxy-3-methylbut-2-en-1-yl diphosphate synthase (flavodoxin) n=1 Tax=Desulfobacula toluolica (strain DSM 7467 / Tol2) TaxID=651182 RepID=K0NCF1_DESTT|nr:flavodoxin-dependent (E)-4-hydroxy-3-methylbut-2-enyl-diphosphate synthase [Desulfobacula toluolica]CCK82149.1 IspG: 4-hydroxy-3-methylbut-2-en-1-yl diphosphate synthase [Desulfobacula toluolica Tol2]